MNFDDLSPSDLALLHSTIYDNPYIPAEYYPHKKQIEALLNPAKELFFGGATGGGKTVWLALLSLQYQHLQKYNVLILRRNFLDMMEADAIIPTLHEMLEATDAKYNGSDKIYRFPKGGTIKFGHLEHEKSKYKYRSAQFHLILFEEVTDFSRSQYLYLWTRLRKAAKQFEYNIPLRFRATGNPDGPGFDWVKSRFVDPGDPARPYIPSILEDNPSVDESYLESLAELDPITFARMRWGNWSAKVAGNFFKTDNIEVVDSWPSPFANDIVRRWDLAATAEPDEFSSDDPDYSVGLKGARVDGIYYIINMDRGRWAPEETDRRIVENARNDGIGTRVVVEQEPGASGKRDIIHIRRLLPNYAVSGKPSSGDKLIRARPAASLVNQGRVKILRGAWNQAFIDELTRVSPETYGKKGYHDDIMDDLSGLIQDIDTPEFEPLEINVGIAAEQDAEFGG